MGHNVGGYIKRHTKAAVEKPTNMFGAVPVTGSRQVGKTTMLQQITGGISKLILFIIIPQIFVFYK